MNMFRDNPFQQLNDILVAADCHQLQAVYAGVGARKTPRDVLHLMTRIAVKLDEWGWGLRSGGAEGADEAFDHAVSRAEIYLPWPKFAANRNRTHPLPTGPEITTYGRPTVTARDIAAKHHPRWTDLEQGVRKLHARNAHEILGRDCASPSAMVVCWTPDGSTGITTAHTGGTGQAILIAIGYRVPIFNLARPDHRAAWEDAIR
jgi:hypothetical protein